MSICWWQWYTVSYKYNRSWKIKKSSFDKAVDENDVTYIEIEVERTKVIIGAYLLMKILRVSYKWNLEYQEEISFDKSVDENDATYIEI